MADPTDSPEQWRPLTGFEGRYSASDRGRIRSDAGFTRVEKTPGRLFFRRRPERILRPAVLGTGYQMVNVGWPQKGCNVHVLVCEAWHGAKPAWADCVRHLDGNKLNNSASNLAWGTNSENGLDMMRHGTQTLYRGEENSLCRYSDEQLASALLLIDRGSTITAAAASIGIDASYLGKIRTKARRASFSAPNGAA